MDGQRTRTRGSCCRQLVLRALALTLFATLVQNVPGAAAAGTSNRRRNWNTWSPDVGDCPSGVGCWCNAHLADRCYGYYHRLDQVSPCAWCTGFPVAGGVHSVKAVDWDKDGDVDLILGGDAGQVYVLIRTALDGTNIFQSTTLHLNHTSVVNSTVSVDVVDWDNDGRWELFLGTPQGLLFFKQDLLKKDTLNEVTGKSNPIAGLSINKWSWPQAVDWDGDSDMDLWLGTLTGLRYFENQRGQLVELINNARPIIGLAPWPAYPRAADWDGDGDLDLLLWFADSTGSWRLNYYLRQADGRLMPSSAEGLLGTLTDAWSDLLAHAPAVQNESYWPEAVDWDGDGDLDLLAIEEGTVGGAGYRVLYFERTTQNGPKPAEVPGSKSSVAALELDVGSNASPKEVDIDGDLLPELLVGTADGDVRYFHVEELTGNYVENTTWFNASVKLVGPALRGQEVTVEAADWDGDGHPDLLLGTGRRIRFFKYQSNSSTFQEIVGKDNPFRGLTFDRPVPRAADWNGDGRVDLFVGAGDGVLWYFVQQPDGSVLDASPALQANISGTFTLSTSVPAESMVGCTTLAPDVVDWDRDGDLDILVGFWSAQFGGRVGCLDRQADGTLNGTWTLSVPGNRVVPSASAMDLGVPELLVGLQNGRLQHFANGRCEIAAPCSASGICQPGVGRCDCLIGHTSGDCSKCDADYFTPPDPNKLADHRCSQCPASKGLVCNDRGQCLDDAFALGLANGTKLAGVVAGNGSCLCNNTYFHGAACEVGGCPHGYEEVYDGNGSDVKRKICKPCGTGRYADDGGTCQDCPSGHYGAMGGGCLQCMPGTYSAKAGSRTCAACSSGTYSWYGSDDCAECGIGTMASDNNTNCTPCAPGTVSSQKKDTCNLCEGGTFASQYGSGSCEFCPAKYYSTAGSTSCQECALFSTSSRGSSTCATDSAYILAMLAGFSVQFLGVFVLCFHFRRKVRIVDVSQLGDKVVVTTFFPHMFKRYEKPLSRGGCTRVYLQETGHFQLDAQADFCADILDEHRLELLDEQGCPIKYRVDASMGSMRQRFPDCWTHTGFLLPSYMVSTIMCVLPWLGIFMLRMGNFFSTRPRPVILAGLLVAADFAAVLLGALFAILLRGWNRRQKTPMQQRLIHFEAELLEGNPQPTSVERGPLRAVSAKQLTELLYFFKDFIQLRTAYYLDPNIIRPLTRSHQLSFAELAGPKPVDFFVSHFWGTAFTHFVDTVQHHAQSVGKKSPLGEEEWESLAYWVCFLSNNQWAIGDELGSGDWTQSSFFLALRSGHCRATCMVLDADALPLTRSWCLFEVLQTYRLVNEGVHNFGGLFYCTNRGVIGADHAECFDISIALAKRLASLDLRKATASSKEDEQMIADLVVKEGGFHKMNEFIRTNMTKTLGVVQAQFVKNVGMLELDLCKKDTDRDDPMDMLRSAISKGIRRTKDPLGKYLADSDGSDEDLKAGNNGLDPEVIILDVQDERAADEGGALGAHATRPSGKPDSTVARRSGPGGGRGRGRGSTRGASRNRRGASNRSEILVPEGEVQL